LLSHFFHLLVILFFLSLSISSLLLSFHALICPSLYKLFSEISPVLFPRTMHTREIYKRWGFYIQLGARERGGEDGGRERGAAGGGKHTQPSGVVKRLRVGSTDCVGLTSRHLTHARAQGKSFSPPVSFGLFQRFMCGCRCACAQVSCPPSTSLQSMALDYYSPNFCWIFNLLLVMLVCTYIFWSGCGTGITSRICHICISHSVY
jgi:hypothetical protein